MVRVSKYSDRKLKFISTLCDVYLCRKAFFGVKIFKTPPKEGTYQNVIKSNSIGTSMGAKSMTAVYWLSQRGQATHRVLVILLLNEVIASCPHGHVV